MVAQPIAPYAAWKWREHIQQANDKAYFEYGEDSAWPGILPYEVSEALIDMESQGDPTAINPTPMYNGEHATGLMQIVPGLSVTGGYESVTGKSVTSDELLNPETNLEVGAIGLAQRAIDVQRTGQFGYDKNGNKTEITGPNAAGPDWPSVVQIGWFGAGYQDGYGFWQPDDNVTDEPTGITGGAYRTAINTYISGFGSAVLNNLNAGKWRTASDATRETWAPYNARYGEEIFGNDFFTWVEGKYEFVKDVGKTVTDIQGLVDFVTNVGNWVRLAIILGAVALVGMGVSVLLF